MAEPPPEPDINCLRGELMAFVFCRTKNARIIHSSTAPTSACRERRNPRLCFAQLAKLRTLLGSGPGAALWADQGGPYDVSPARADQSARLLASERCNAHVVESSSEFRIQARDPGKTSDICGYYHGAAVLSFLI